jgi:UDP-GlcNAc:undecaprenyl-phosphate GlcNAc-1-phosphate transferase
MELILVLLFSAVLSLVLHPAAIRVSRLLNLFDDPYRDQIHKSPTPVLGGAAICFSILIAVVTANIFGVFHWSRLASGILVGGILIALVGFIDDRYGLSATIKMAGQILAGGLFVVFADVQLGIFHPVVEFGASIFFLVAMMNAFNILDNMDAVTGSMSFAAGLSFLVVFILSDNPDMAILVAAVIGALIGFLRYNMPRARIFMGDSGAMFLGFLFGVLAIIYLANNRSFYLLTTPFLILSYPIFDITLVSFARLREMRSLSVAAPDSSPYRLVRWVFSTKNAFWVILIVNLILGSMGVGALLLKGSQFSVLLIFISGLSLSVFGVHLYRNFLYFFERTIFFFVDLFSINLAFFFIYSIKYSSGLLHYDVYITYADMFAPALWMSIFWVLLFSVMGLYEIRPDRRFSLYVLAITKIVGAGLVGFIILNIFYEGSIVISFWPIILYLIALIMINCLFKYISFLVVRLIHNRPGKKPKAIFLVKNQKNKIQDALIFAERRFRLEGYLSQETIDSIKLPYLGDISSLSDVIRNKRIEKIILIWPENEYEECTAIFKSSAFLENQFLTIYPPPLPLKGLKVERLNEGSMYRISMEFLRTWEWAVKRAFDLMLSAILLVLTSPIFLYKYFRAKTTNQPFLKKHVFYGRDEQERFVYSFADQADNGNNYYLPLGLPSLLTVFNGHLSFVGTIPLSPGQYHKDQVMVPGFWRRKFVKPGLFGPGRESGPSGYFDCELRYIENMSILLDIWWLIVGIFKLILPGKQAYA